jgi:hypothetical protein
VSKRDSDDFDTFTADDIDAAFENNFVQLKYSQHHMLTGIQCFILQIRTAAKMVKSLVCVCV